MAPHSPENAALKQRKSAITPEQKGSMAATMGTWIARCQALDEKTRRTEQFTCGGEAKKGKIASSPNAGLLAGRGNSGKFFKKIVASTKKIEEAGHGFLGAGTLGIRGRWRKK
jgi:hypothetical protein